ncbi:unnamed protein product [Sphenostylis stenocarpa]|uniref:Uncharacterized protein n=1 Tax=Sphenostylis stenocarpa TaxID=92480 RepID=A0AA86T8F4_9FABA|nr:unnamed protein product [Sphenostylis stenocarpa]
MISPPNPIEINADFQHESEMLQYMLEDQEHTSMVSPPPPPMGLPELSRMPQVTLDLLPILDPVTESPPNLIDVAGQARAGQKREPPPIGSLTLGLGLPLDLEIEATTLSLSQPGFKELVKKSKLDLNLKI